MTAPDLLPCPFCGSVDLTIREMDEEWHVVSCNGCNAEGGYYPPNDSTMPEEAATFWNTRAPLAEALVVPEVAALVKAAKVGLMDLEAWLAVAGIDDAHNTDMTHYAVQELTAALRAIGEPRNG